MSEEASFAAPSDKPAVPVIDITDERIVQTWATKLNASAQQIHDAVAEVGSAATDVEEHLKGTRSTTNAEQTRRAP